MLIKKIVVLFIFVVIIAPIITVNASEVKIITKNNVLNINTNNYPNIINMINLVNKTNITKDLEGLVEIGPRYTGSKNCDKAAEYIYNELKKTELYTYIDEWKYIRYKGKNVVSIKNGTDPSSDKVFLIFSHYDTITFPYNSTTYSQGANCGGSGIAVMLEVAEVLSRYSFNHTLKFIAFSGEHVGTYGSQDYARKAYFKNENIYAAINLDALGEANSKKEGNFIKASFQERSRFLFNLTKEISKKYKQNINLDAIFDLDMPCDHYSFYKYGFDGIMFKQYAPMHNVDTPKDTIDKINFTYLTKVTKLAVALGSELASRPIDLQIRIVTPYEDYIYLFNKPLLKLPNFNLDRTNYDGATILFGMSFVTVKITSNEEIEKISFCIDDILYTLYNTIKTKWKIKGFISPLIGRHKIGTYVFTKSGKIAYDEMDVYLFILNCSYPLINPFWQKWLA